jgi:hypothetical protein
MISFSAKKNWLILFLCMTLSFSCGGKVTTRTEDEQQEFTINGVVVKDRNLEKDFVYVNVLRNSEPYQGAMVQAGAHILTNQGGGNYYKEGPSLFTFGQNVSVTVTCPDDFTLAASVVMPGNFSIVSLPANDTLNAGGHSVAVTWNPSAQSSGYFLSVAKPGAVPGTVGYAARDENKDRAETIPPDAFRDGLTLVEGLYEVYVIAYYGGFPAYPEMPFELPDGLPTGNINGANGTMGAGVIAEKARIRVTTE